MLTRAAAVLASLAVVQGVGAEVNTRITWQVSVNGIDWSGGIVMRQPGATYHVRAVASYIGTEAPVGLASFVFQPTVSNWSQGDILLPFVNGGQGGNTSTPPGVVPADGPGYGRVVPWGWTALRATSFLRGHTHTGGAGGAPAGSWLRIAQNQVTAWIGGTGNTTGGSGVPISQLNMVGRSTGDPAFNGELQNIVVFRMGIDLSDFIPTFDPIVIDSPVEGFGNRNATTGEREVYWFASMTEATGSIRGTAIVEPVSLVLPTPASLVVGLVGLVAVRRRERLAAR
jgi:hypothetical protein